MIGNKGVRLSCRLYAHKLPLKKLLIIRAYKKNSMNTASNGKLKGINQTPNELSTKGVNPKILRKRTLLLTPMFSDYTQGHTIPCQVFCLYESHFQPQSHHLPEQISCRSHTDEDR